MARAEEGWARPPGGARGFPHLPGALTHPGHRRWLRAVPGIDWRVTLWPQAPQVAPAAVAWIRRPVAPDGSWQDVRRTRWGLGHELGSPPGPAAPQSRQVTLAGHTPFLTHVLTRRVWPTPKDVSEGPGCPRHLPAARGTGRLREACQEEPVLGVCRQAGVHERGTHGPSSAEARGARKPRRPQAAA